MKADAGLDLCPTALSGEAIEHLEEAVFFEDADDRAGSVDANRGELAHQEKAEDVVEVCAGQDDSGDRGVAQALCRVWVDFRVIEELLAKVGGGVDQEPCLTISRYG